MGEVVTTLPHEFLDRAMATVVDAGDRRGWILRQLSVVTSSMQQSYERDVHSCVP